MSYTIYHASGSAQPITINDGQKDTSTSLTLVGKNYPNYGVILNQNFLYLLENFSNNNSPPTNPTKGQLYYETSQGTGVLKVCYDGKTFKNVCCATSGGTQPTTAISTVGDLWWNTGSQTLNCYNGTAWVTIGPLSGSGQVVSEDIAYTGGTASVISFKINSTRYAILSSTQSFTPLPPGIEGFASINPGLNIASTGLVANNKFWGQASDSAALGGQTASKFIRNDISQTTNGTITINNNGGLYIGSSNKGQLNYATNEFYIDNTTNNGVIRLRNYASGSPRDALDIIANGSTQVNYDLIVAGNLSLTNGSTNLIITGTNPSYNTTTGALQVRGGTGIAGNINVGGTVNNFSGNITASYVTAYGNVFTNAVQAGQIGNVGSYVTGTLTTASQPNITSTGTLVTLTVSGNVYTGNVQGTYVAGTVLTNTQPYINTLGTLTGLTVTGNENHTGANVYLGNVGNVTIGGGTNGQFLTSNGAGGMTFTTLTVPTVVKSSTIAYVPVYDSTTTVIGSSALQFGSGNLSVTGNVTATGEITAYYSDDRLKTRLGNIENALDKICALQGFYYEANDVAQALGFPVKREVGISAQDTQSVLPEIVAPAPVDSTYLTIHYERLAPLMIEAIKELKKEIEDIKGRL
jgi:Chaperone of endosialidase